jgi:hypothetical protein
VPRRDGGGVTRGLLLALLFLPAPAALGLAGREAPPPLNVSTAAKCVPLAGFLAGPGKGFAELARPDFVRLAGFLYARGILRGRADRGFRRDAGAAAAFVFSRGDCLTGWAVLPSGLADRVTGGHGFAAPEGLEI